MKVKNNLVVVITKDGDADNAISDSQWWVSSGQRMFNYLSHD